MVAEPLVLVVDRAEPVSDGREVLRVGLQLGAVKAGEYQLRFELGGSGAASQVARAPTRSLPLRVRVVPEATGEDGGDLPLAAALLK